MEELLNKLIEKGWLKKPHQIHGLPNKPFLRMYKDSINWIQFYFYEWWDNEAKLVKVYSLRDIVSKNSWLWQFVCENGMIKEQWIAYVIDDFTTTEYEHWTQKQYQYWVLESALCDEDKLEEFLLDNIKVE